MVTLIVHNFVYSPSFNNDNLGEKKCLCLLGRSGGGSLSTWNNLAVFHGQRSLGTAGI